MKLILCRSAVVTSFALTAILFFLCISADAQQPKKVPRIGYLTGGDAARASTGSEGAKLALRELGYIEGKNIAIEHRYTEENGDLAPELAAELVRLKVDIIVAAGGGRIIQAAKNSTKTIPIVMMGAGIDPVEAGLVESLARPGGNVTGFSTLSSVLDGKRLELLKDAVPKLAHVALLYDPATLGNVLNVKNDIPAAARALGLTVRSWEVRTASDFDRVFDAMGKQRPDGLYVPQGRLMSDNENRIINFALKSKLPSVYPSREAVDAGGFMYYGADLTDSYRRVASYVDKILKGAKPGELPVERPTKFELIINLKTAKQIGLTIPQKVLARADRVIR